MAALLYPGCFQVPVQLGAAIGHPLNPAAASTLLPHTAIPNPSTALCQVPTLSLLRLPPPQHLRSEVGSHRLPPRWHRRRLPISGPPLARAPRAASPQPATARSVSSSSTIDATQQNASRTSAGSPMATASPETHTTTTYPWTPPTAPTSTAVFRALHSTRTTGRWPHCLDDEHPSRTLPTSASARLSSGTRSGPGRQLVLLSPARDNLRSSPSVGSGISPG